MYSFHSSLEEKNQLLYTLTQYGIETTVDRSKKKDRIREWIQSSAIAEENEEESEFEDFEDEWDMKGKHFPERRQSVCTTTKNRKASRGEIPRDNESDEKNQRSKTDKNELSNKNDPHSISPSKTIERKNPFAPQVAEERKIVAKFANFPNGDPNLGFQGSGFDFKSQSLMDKSNTELNEQMLASIKDHPFNEKSKIDTSDSTGSSDTRKERIRFVFNYYL